MKDQERGGDLTVKEETNPWDLLKEEPEQMEAKEEIKEEPDQETNEPEDVIGSGGKVQLH